MTFSGRWGLCCSLLCFECIVGDFSFLALKWFDITFKWGDVDTFFQSGDFYGFFSNVFFISTILLKLFEFPFFVFFLSDFFCLTFLILFFHCLALKPSPNGFFSPSSSSSSSDSSDSSSPPSSSSSSISSISSISSSSPSSSPTIFSN